MIGKALAVLVSFTLAARSASAQTTPTVTSKVVAVSKCHYAVYDYADPTHGSPGDPAMTLMKLPITAKLINPLIS
jgi:hypothetical protein